jgi:hypothetical protein
MPECIQIVDWDKHYENNRTRDLKRMEWVPLPINLSGDGYTELIDHKNGAAHFGAWCALVEVAARCGTRGTLMRDNGTPHDKDSLYRITRIPVSVWAESIPRLVSIGWISLSVIQQDDAGKPQEGAAPAQDSDYGMEGNGTEGKKERKDTFEPLVTLSASENEKLIKEYGETNTRRAYTKLSVYKQSNGKKYKSDYAAILNWVMREVMAKGAVPEPTRTQKQDLGEECAYCNLHGGKHTENCGRPR